MLVQVNCSDEPQKGGVEPEGLPALLDALAGLARIEVRGLMTMSALTDDTGEQRRAFRRLRELRDSGRASAATGCPSCRWECRATTRWPSRKGPR